MNFSFASTPQLHFGAGKISGLPSMIRTFGPNVLLVTGAKSFLESPKGRSVLEDFHFNKIAFQHTIIAQEPTPSMIDEAVKKNSSFHVNAVVAIGGGSVLDAGKAISAMLPLREPVKKYLEGVGTAVHPGSKVPFIAIPTTAGTGSEATKNAVLSETGEHGFKKSLRHNKFVPDVAIIDPSLTVNCPPMVTASSGMDAFTQLLESYLSTTASPMTNALAEEGLRHISRSLLKAYHDGSDVSARTDMALASYLSGITLANAGLGVVHGFASSAGGFFDIPHGVICSTLMAASNKVTVRKLRAKSTNDEGLMKYTAAGRLFSAVNNKSGEYYADFILDLMENWKVEMNIPSLKKYGVTSSDHKRIAQVTDNKNNPVALSEEEMIEVLELSAE